MPFFGKNRLRALCYHFFQRGKNLTIQAKDSLKSKNFSSHCQQHPSLKLCKKWRGIATWLDQTLSHFDLQLFLYTSAKPSFSVLNVKNAFFKTGFLTNMRSIIEGQKYLTKFHILAIEATRTARRKRAKIRILWLANVTIAWFYVLNLSKTTCDYLRLKFITVIL